MYQRMRQQTYESFAPEQGGRVGQLLDWFIIGLIAVNVGAVIVGTVDTIATRFTTPLRLLEWFSVITFTVEYLARVWSAVEADQYEQPVLGRLRFATRPMVLVDLFAILPFYLFLFGPAVDLRFLRILRLFRLLRLIKFARYSESLREFRTVLRDKKPDLVITTFANLLLLALVSSIMYHAERVAQPDVFSSIPKTMWWGVTTLTTVGYGDVVPVTPFGRALAALAAIIGIGLFALPASILASGFIEAASTDDEDNSEWGTVHTAANNSTSSHQSSPFIPVPATNATMLAVTPSPSSA